MGSTLDEEMQSISPIICEGTNIPFTYPFNKSCLIYSLPILIMLQFALTENPWRSRDSDATSSLVVNHLLHKIPSFLPVASEDSITAG